MEHLAWTQNALHFIKQVQLYVQSMYINKLSDHLPTHPSIVVFLDILFFTSALLGCVSCSPRVFLCVAQLSIEPCPVLSAVFLLMWLFSS